MERKTNQTIIEEEGEFSDAIETSQEEPIGDTDYQIQAATMKNPADIGNILSSPRKQNPQEHYRNVFESLVDRGENGGIAGSDVMVITRTDRVVDVTGIDNHQIVKSSYCNCWGCNQVTKR